MAAPVSVSGNLTVVFSDRLPDSLFCLTYLKIGPSLTLPVPCISESYIKLYFYFQTSFWCLKRFYEGIKGLYKTFCGTTKKCENKNLS